MTHQISARLSCIGILGRDRKEKRHGIKLGTLPVSDEKQTWFSQENINRFTELAKYSLTTRVKKYRSARLTLFHETIDGDIRTCMPLTEGETLTIALQ